MNVHEPLPCYDIEGGDAGSVYAFGIKAARRAAITLVEDDGAELAVIELDGRQVERAVRGPHGVMIVGGYGTELR